MNNQTINILNQIKEKGIKKVSLGFSTGKDSLFGLNFLLKNGIEVIPVYFYIVPGIDFIEENLRLYEKYYNMHIIRLAHPILQDFINYTQWQTLEKAKFMGQFWSKESKHHTFQGIMKAFFEHEGISVEYDCNCMKMSDSLNRRLLLRNKPDIDDEKKIIYLAKYLKTSEIWQYIRENKLPLTRDYEIFGRSADNLLNYQYLIGIKKNYPNDFAKIKEMFPLCEVEIKRYEAYQKIYEYGKK